jgi:serine-type D-Ala-D-Ala carboxypeptidase/endopeptidase (penicillin-binding protein 4)
MKIVHIIIAILLVHSGFAQKIDSLKLVGFSDAVLELENSELIRHGVLAVCVKNAKDGQTIFSLNHERSLPSASTLKLVSTATVLAVLGGDFRYQTFLEYDGEIKNDTLTGNLYLRGTGDPSLGSDRFKEYPIGSKLIGRWTAAVLRAGIKHIKGKVIVDDSFFDGNTVADSWIYGDLGNYYGAGVSGLNFGENLYKVKFKPGVNIGDPAPVSGVDPTVPGLNFANFVTTGEKGSGDQVTIYGSPLSESVILRGTVPAGFSSFTVKGSLPNPAKYVSGLLMGSLMGASVSVLKTLDSSALQKPILSTRKILDEYQSPPMRELCQQTNWWSINLFADAFLRLVGKKLAGKSDYNGASESVTNFWKSRNADMRGFYIKDGSGLSPSGSLTVQNLTEILVSQTKEKSFPDFYKSIAVLGVNGTVRNLGKGSRAVGNVRAKSGSIEGTRAYSGYVTSKSGALLSFAMIAHKYQPESSRIVSEELVKLMALLAEL